MLCARHCASYFICIITKALPGRYCYIRIEIKKADHLLVHQFLLSTKSVLSIVTCNRGPGII